MKYLMHFVPNYIWVLGVLFLSGDLYGTVTVCLPQFELGCMSYDEFSFDEGESWVEACCEYIVSEEFNCVDDCNELEYKNINRIAATAAGMRKDLSVFEGIQWNAETNSGEERSYTLEFIEEGVKLNSEIITSFSEKVNAVKVTLPNSKLEFILKLANS